MTELVSSAALLVDGEVHTEPPPARHGLLLRRLGIDRKSLEAVQGFVTSRGRFVDRVQAGEIALKAGQIQQLAFPPSLFTEDLW